MKNILIVLLVVVIVGGVAYLLLAPEGAQAPVTNDAPANDRSADDGASEAEADYVGQTVAEAEALAASNEVMFRVVERDGEMLPTTRDYRPGRINAVVEAGVVVDYTVEGQTGNSEAAPAPGDPNPADEPAVDEDDAAGSDGEHDAIIGMTEAEAAAYAEANDVPFRVGFIDGEALPLTMDYRPGRITAELEGGVVTGYSVE